MRNKQRVEKLEEHFIGDDLTVYIPSILDSSIPKDFYIKTVNGQDLTILSREEYIQEISMCNGLIVVGAE